MHTLSTYTLWSYVLYPVQHDVPRMHIIYYAYGQEGID